MTTQQMTDFRRGRELYEHIRKTDPACGAKPTWAEYCRAAVQLDLRPGYIQKCVETFLFAD